MEFKIRPYHKSDLISLYKICLLTGDSGSDATYLYKDPNLLGSYFAAPYAVMEPELCFIATADEQPCGYILGTKNCYKFSERCENEWFDVLRKKYSYPDENEKGTDVWIRKLIHDGFKVKDDYKDYPAELHIDILPIGQGQGFGKKLMNTFISKLKDLEVSALHLEVGKKNENAIGFYKKYGFHIINEYEFSIGMGVKL
ncbi:MAG: GNAT family N-acetyltransferase [Melioribacteraceae bacterium]|nr:GNAT family N-acetyltransferase [Melioribacteraceae bacterium]